MQKKMFRLFMTQYWIEGTTERFRGYTYFSENPEQMIEWYNKFD